MVMNTRSEEEESIKDDFRVITGDTNIAAAPAAARSLQSCPTLCDPIDSSPPGSPVPGILGRFYLYLRRNWAALNLQCSLKI